MPSAPAPNNKRRRPASHLRARLGAVASALEALVGDASALETGDLPSDRAEVLDTLPAALYLARTIVAHGEEPPVGFILPHEAVIAIGAAMLMIPDPPGEITEDISAGFEEAFNIAVGAWNDGAKPTMRWGSAVEHRETTDASPESVTALIEDADLELLPLKLALGEASFRVYLFGPARLLFKEEAEAFSLRQEAGTPEAAGPDGPEMGQAVEVAEPPAAPSDAAGDQPVAPPDAAPAAPAVGASPLDAQADAGGAPSAAAQAVRAKADAGGAPSAAAQAVRAKADTAQAAPGPPPSRSPAVASPPRPNAPPPGVVVSGASSAGSASAGLGAEILLVDPEGVLRAFIVSKIRSGEIRVYRGTGAPPALGPTASAILIRPTAETIATVRADRTVVVRGARARAAGPDARADVEIAAA